MLIDAFGSLTWHKRINIFNQDDAFSIEVLHDGYLVAGETGRQVFGLQESFAFAAKFTADGNLVWQKLIGLPCLYSRTVKVHLDTDSTALLVGNSEERYPGSPSFAGGAFIETIKFDNEVVTHIENDKTPLPAAYPSPFSGKLNIRCRGNCSATVITLQGQVAGKFTAEADASFLTLDTYDLTEGIYIIDVKEGGKQYRFRVLKVRE